MAGFVLFFAATRMGNITHPLMHNMAEDWVILPMRRHPIERYIIDIRGAGSKAEHGSSYDTRGEGRTEMKKLIATFAAIAAVVVIASSNGGGSDSVNWGGRLNPNQADSVNWGAPSGDSVNWGAHFSAVVADSVNWGAPSGDSVNWG